MLKAAESPGLYELRYILNAGAKVLARHSLEVLLENAQLSFGAQLEVPATAVSGGTIDVSWSAESESSDLRLTLARSDQAVFTWITATKIDGPPPIQLKLPDEPSFYEIRLLDVAGREVLSRAAIQVR